MYKFNNRELMNKVKNGYKKVMESRKMCDNRDYEHKKDAITLGDIEKYDTYNKGVHTMYTARVEEIRKGAENKFERSMMMEELARNSGAIGIANKLYPLTDGRLFVAGGHIQNNVGLDDAFIYL